MTRDEVVKLLEPYNEDDLRYIREVANSLQEEKRTERKKAEIETSVAKYQGKWFTHIESHRPAEHQRGQVQRDGDRLGAHRHPVEQADLPRLCAPGTIHKETAGHDRRFHDQRTVGWG